MERSLLACMSYHRERFFVFRRRRCEVSVPDSNQNCVSDRTRLTGTRASPKYNRFACFVLQVQTRLRSAHGSAGSSRAELRWLNYMKSPNAAHAIRAIPLSSRAGDLFSYASAVQDFQKYLSLQKRAGPLLTGRASRVQAVPCCLDQPCSLCCSRIGRRLILLLYRETVLVNTNTDSA